LGVGGHLLETKQTSQTTKGDQIPRADRKCYLLVSLPGGSIYSTGWDLRIRKDFIRRGNMLSTDVL
jgi:hypothetical protein